MKLNKICYIFGHTGAEEESGHHVCSRCDLHAYWDSDKYQKSFGLIPSFFIFLRRKKEIFVAKCGDFTYRLFKRKEDNDLPF